MTYNIGELDEESMVKHSKLVIFNQTFRWVS